MEVKNPLFLDDPTPATPAAASVGTAQPAVTVKQQPQQPTVNIIPAEPNTGVDK